MDTAPHNETPQRVSDRVLSIYGDEYVSDYNRLYLHPWKSKHALNIRNIARLLPRRTQRAPAWLDLCCGQAWHFTNFPNGVKKIGVDISNSQLEAASRNNPDAVFLCHDVLSAPLREEAFDLVSCFWGAYCYLDSNGAIAQLMRNATSWTRPGGALYFEILLPRNLETFNGSQYAGDTGFRVQARNADFSKWAYRDSGGRHVMTSPPLDFFIELLSPHFAAVEAEHDGGFMTHLIATEKLSQRTCSQGGTS